MMWEEAGPDRERSTLGDVSLPRVAATAVTACLFLLLGAGEVSAQETGRVTGTVTDAETQEPLEGVQVSVRGTGLGDLTSADGTYSIRAVPAGSQTVRVQLIGYSQRSRDVEVSAGQTTTADFQIRQEALEMESIVVTGTGGQVRRREIGNSITQISSEQINEVPKNNVSDVLQGRTSGASILQNSGQVGAGSTIRIRGINTLQRQQPLIYVDGQRVDNTSSRSFEDEVNQSVNFLDNLNPEDIDRIEVVKGPAATTLYGTEASAGVIQIFTKGGAGATGTSWSFRVDQGLNQLPRIGPENDPTELGMRCGEVDPVPELCPEDGTYYKTGHRQDYSLSVRGGVEDFDYYLSGSGKSETGVIDPQGEERWNLRGNFGFQPASDFRIQFNNQVSSRDVTWIPDGNNAEGLLLNVFRGDAGYTPNNNDGLALEMQLDTHVDAVTSGVNMTWTPTAGIEQTLKAGLDHQAAQYEEVKPFNFFTTPRGNRESDESVSRVLSLDYTGTWSTDVASDFSSRFTWGGQLFHEHEKRLNGFGERFPGPGEYLVEDGARTTIFDEDRVTVVEGGAFFQEQVSWQDQLFVTAGLRIDGNSTFGDDFGAELYPKLQASYMLSDNEFWPEWWGTMKLRGALGRSGTSPGPFDKLRTWSAVGVSGEPAVTPGNVGNPNLGPEITTETEVGFESAFADGRVDLEFTYYDQTTRDALLNVSPIPSEGFISSQIDNVGKFTNAGIETALNLDVVRGSDLSWSLGGHFSTNETEVVDLGEQERLYVGWYQWVIEGEPVPVVQHERVRNPDAPFDEAEFASDSVLGPSSPTRSAGVNTDLRVGDLTLRATGTFEMGHVIPSGTAYQNVRRRAWPGQPPGASATCPEIQQRIDEGNTSGLTAQDRGMCDINDTSYGMWTRPADFFKLRSAQLSYNLPRSVVPAVLSSARITLSGRNLIKITDYPGIDPEATEDGSSTGALWRMEYYNLPPLRTFSASLNLNW